MMKNKVIKIILICLITQAVYRAQIDLALAQQANLNVTLLSHTGYIDLSGYYHVVGEVQNVGDHAIHNVIVEVSYFNIDDEFIDKRFDKTMLNIILSDRKSPFDIMLLDEYKSNNVKDYQINITYSETNDVGKYIKILNYSSSIDEAGMLQIKGSIINLGEYTARNIKIIATYYDDKGDVVAANYVDVDPEFNYLNPNQMKEFEILLEEDRSILVDKYELTAESSIYALIQTPSVENNTFVEVPSTGSITVVKDAVPDDVQVFSFTGDLGAFDLDDDGVGDNDAAFADQSAGLYDVTETVPAGWDLTGIDVVGDADGGSVVDLATDTVTVDLDAGEDITVTFTNKKEYTLTVDTVGDGYVSKDPDQAVYLHGDSVGLTAIPADGWEFSEWTGDLTGNVNPEIIVMDGEKAVTAISVRSRTNNTSWGTWLLPITLSLLALAIILALKGSLATSSARALK